MRKSQELDNQQERPEKVSSETTRQPPNLRTDDRIQKTEK